VRRTLLPLVIVLSLLLGLSASSVSAGTSTQAGVTVTTPSTYSSCVDSQTSDVVSITGLTGSGYTMRGQLIVDFVLDDGSRQTIQTVPVDTIADVNITVTYPPVSQWPVHSDGTREVHVDVQFELWLFNSVGEMIASFGGGLDWDVFCIGDPPPPPPPPGGTQGCTPGYWKQSHHFDSYPAPYTPTTTFKSVFGVGPNSALSATAAANGGGEKAMLRHATAALLNAAHGGVDSVYTVDQVIAIVQSAYATGQFESAKNLFEAANERGCPLN